jgi:hypothetical protein
MKAETLIELFETKFYSIEDGAVLTLCDIDKKQNIVFACEEDDNGRHFNYELDLNIAKVTKQGDAVVIEDVFIGPVIVRFFESTPIKLI